MAGDDDFSAFRHSRVGEQPVARLARRSRQTAQGFAPVHASPVADAEAPAQGCDRAGLGGKKMARRPWSIVTATSRVAGEARSR